MRVKLPALASLFVLLALSACAPPRVWEQRCPPQGASVTWDNGTTLAFAGRDPANGLLCLARRGDAEARLILGMLEQGPTEGRGHPEGLAPLYPARANNNARYRSTSTSAGSGIQYDFDNFWRVVGFEFVTVPAGRFDAVVLERRIVAAAPNDQSLIMRYFVDTASGILVKRDVTIERGGSVQRTFQATRAQVPPDRPPPRMPN